MYISKIIIEEFRGSLYELKKGCRGIPSTVLLCNALYVLFKILYLVPVRYWQNLIFEDGVFEFVE